MFYEFVEIATAKELGFETVDELRVNDATFDWYVVTPYTQDDLHRVNVAQKVMMN